MKFVEVDARGLTPSLAISITKRALMVACGKPVIISLDSIESRDGVLEFVQGRKLRCDVKELDGCYRMEIGK